MPPHLFRIARMHGAAALVPVDSPTDSFVDGAGWQEPEKGGCNHRGGTLNHPSLGKLVFGAL
jgi:hypothetical protein